MAPLSVTIGIPTFLRDDVLVASIQQVLKQEPPADEIVLVDQTPHHNHATYAFLGKADEEGRLRWVRQEKPSLTAARNRILAEARGDIVIFIDDDVLLPPGYVYRHARHFADRRVAAVSGPIYPPSTPHRGTELQDHGGTLGADVELPSEEVPGNGRVTAMADCPDSGCVLLGLPALKGGNHSVRREAAVDIGGYDESFQGPASFEETDFAFRLYDAGGLIVYDPRAWLTHLKVPSGGCRIPGTRTWNEWEKTINFALFFFRHISAKFPFQVWYQHWKGMLRAGPLRRENVVKPWRQPWAWASFAYACYEARKRCRAGVMGRFVHNGDVQGPRVRAASP